MRHQLLNVLRECGKTAELLTLRNGAQVLLTPYGARVLGLFAPADERNFFWTSAALENVETAKDLFASDQWQNTGGDRTWLSPEIDFFFPNYPDLSVYHQPREFDPGRYQFTRRGDGGMLASEFTVRLSRQLQPVGVRLTKTVAAIPDPLRHESWRPGDAVFTGYGLRTTLEFTGLLAPDVPIGLWHLIQMPHGGEMLIPTYSPVAPGIVFGEIPEGDLRIAPPGVRYRMRAAGEQKVSLRAVDCTGRIGYYHERGGGAELIVRNFFVNPSGDYVDAAWKDANDTGYAVQACNIDNPKFGQFSELEYHIPAIGVPGQPSRCEDFAQTWAWRGPREAIAVIARRMLGAEIQE
jgi:hypothetical protein